MNSYRCDKCFYADSCDKKKLYANMGCECFDPTSEEYDDLVLQEYIERKRNDNRAEWFEYTTSFYG